MPVSTGLTSDIRCMNFIASPGSVPFRSSTTISSWMESSSRPRSWRIPSSFVRAPRPTTSVRASSQYVAAFERSREGHAPADGPSLPQCPLLGRGSATRSGLPMLQKIVPSLPQPTHRACKSSRASRPSPTGRVHISVPVSRRISRNASLSATARPKSGGATKFRRFHCASIYPGSRRHRVHADQHTGETADLR